MSNETAKSAAFAVKVHRGGDFHWVGDGFPVRSIFSYNDLGRELSPFLLLDYAAPYRFPPSDAKRGVGEHPHRGFETVTIAYQGEIEHRDSSGGGGVIGPGDVQWMTAASGLVHEEFHSGKFTRTGGMFEMVQLWVNLPAKFKGAKPGYQTLLNANIPRVTLDDGAGELRVIAGEFNGVAGPARTFTAVNLWDVTLNGQGSLELPLPIHHNKALLVLSGQVDIMSHKAVDGDLVIWEVENAGDHSTVKAATDSRLLIMTGEPIDEPIVGQGPFVMNSAAEIKQAFADFRMGKFGSFES